MLRVDLFRGALLLALLLVGALGEAEARGEPEEAEDADEEADLGGHDGEECSHLHIDEVKGEARADVLLHQSGVHLGECADGLRIGDELYGIEAVVGAGVGAVGSSEDDVVGSSEREIVVHHGCKSFKRGLRCIARPPGSLMIQFGQPLL